MDELVINIENRNKEIEESCEIIAEYMRLLSLFMFMVENRYRFYRYKTCSKVRRFFKDLMIVILLKKFSKLEKSPKTFLDNIRIKIALINRRTRYLREDDYTEYIHLSNQVYRFGSYMRNHVSIYASNGRSLQKLIKRLNLVL